ncbi:MAG: hypothetical protein ABIE03_04780 [Patescibacteria group bacterium]|nr:hypothetical protein [Patescibacteria group bacterium]
MEDVSSVQDAQVGRLEEVAGRVFDFTHRYAIPMFSFGTGAFICGAYLSKPGNENPFLITGFSVAGVLMYFAGNAIERRTINHPDEKIRNIGFFSGFLLRIAGLQLGGAALYLALNADDTFPIIREGLRQPFGPNPNPLDLFKPKPTLPAPTPTPQILPPNAPPLISA